MKYARDTRLAERVSCEFAYCFVVFWMMNSAVSAQSRTAKIVGLGATSCERFTSDVKSNPSIRRDYLAWTQGFMSGVLLSRPAGVDEALDLNPTTFGLLDQLHFLEDHCARNPSADFSDAVEALYKHLRKQGGA